MDRLMKRMIDYYRGDPDRTQHFIKVHSMCSFIGRVEGLDEKQQELLETAALVHDIGIRPSEEKYNSSVGSLQEKEGPPVVEAMLKELGYDETVIERVSYLVGHHHTYTNIDGADYQILVEADFLVNFYEGNSGMEEIKEVYRRIFKTECGKELCRQMYGMEVSI